MTVMFLLFDRDFISGALAADYSLLDQILPQDRKGGAIVAFVGDGGPPPLGAQVARRQLQGAGWRIEQVVVNRGAPAGLARALIGPIAMTRASRILALAGRLSRGAADHADDISRYWRPFDLLEPSPVKREDELAFA